MDEIVLRIVELHSKNKAPARQSEEIREDDQIFPEANKVNYSLVEGGKNLSKKNYVYPHLADQLKSMKPTQFGGSPAFPSDLDKLIINGSQRTLLEMIDKGGLQARDLRQGNGNYFQIQQHRSIQDGNLELPDEPLLGDSLGKRPSFDGQFSPLDGMPAKRHAIESNSLLLHSPDMQHLHMNSRMSSPSNSVSGFKLHPSRKNSDLDDLNPDLKLVKQKSFEDLSLSGL